MNIQIEKIAGKRGERRILVDGVEWGGIHMEGHGVWGVSYWFSQKGNGLIGDPDDRDWKDEPRKLVVKKPRKRHQSSWEYGPPGPPIDLMLERKVHELIERKLLRDPKAVEEEEEQEIARWQESRRKQIQEARERDLKVARDLINKYVSTIIIGTTIEDFAAAIADAIERGRSQ